MATLGGRPMEEWVERYGHSHTHPFNRLVPHARYPSDRVVASAVPRCALRRRFLEASTRDVRRRLGAAVRRACRRGQAAGVLHRLAVPVRRPAVVDDEGRAALDAPQTLCGALQRLVLFGKAEPQDGRGVACRGMATSGSRPRRDPSAAASQSRHPARRRSTSSPSAEIRARGTAAAGSGSLRSATETDRAWPGRTAQPRIVDSVARETRRTRAASACSTRMSRTGALFGFRSRARSPRRTYPIFHPVVWKLLPNEPMTKLRAAQLVVRAMLSCAAAVEHDVLVHFVAQHDNLGAVDQAHEVPHVLGLEHANLTGCAASSGRAIPWFAARSPAARRPSRPE